MYQAIAITESKSSVPTQKTYRTPRVKKGNVGLTPDCNQSTLTHKVPIGQQRCHDCKVIMPFHQFGMMYNNSRDARCINCRADYNQRYGMPVGGQTTKKRSRADDHPKTNQNKLNWLRLSDNPATIHILEKNDQDIQFGTPSPAQPVTLPHINCIQVNAEVAEPRGLEKFDNAELVSAIAKVFHFGSIVSLKCIYPNETYSDLSLWKSQVRELYVAQNPGMDDDYRRVMFDYAQAARDLKNNAARRTTSI